MSAGSAHVQDYNADIETAVWVAEYILVVPWSSGDGDGQLRGLHAPEWVYFRFGTY